MNNNLIMVDREEFNRLLKADQKLTALEVAGVDNWEGYDIALDILKEIEENDAVEEEMKH